MSRRRPDRRPRAVTPLTGRAALDAAMSERQWAKVVEGLLSFYGWRWHHSPDNRPTAAGGRQRVGDRGFPDYVATRDIDGQGPELAFLELKTETGRLGKGQPEWLEALGVMARAVAGLEDEVAYLSGATIAPELKARITVGVYRPSQRRDLEDLLAGPRGRDVYVPSHRDLTDL